jgi:hypothetical protein
VRSPYERLTSCSGGSRLVGIIPKSRFLREQEAAFLLPVFLLTDDTGAGKTIMTGLRLEEEKELTAMSLLSKPHKETIL